MNPIIIETTKFISAGRRTSPGPQPFAGKTPTVCRDSESRLWKLSSTVLSPVERGFEISLFLIAGSFGIGGTIYGMSQLVAFVHSDSLALTIKPILR